MYRIREEYINYFKEIRTNIYAKESGCTGAFYSSVLNGNKRCTETVARAIISIRENLSFREITLRELLEKYFTREEE